MPTRSARQLSWRAPAKISDAEAVCSLTMTVSGAAVSGGPSARTALSSLRAPVSVTTTVIPSAIAAEHSVTPLFSIMLQYGAHRECGFHVDILPSSGLLLYSFWLRACQQSGSSQLGGDLKPHEICAPCEHLSHHP